MEAKVGSTWYQGEIQEKKIDGESIILHVVFSALDTRACTITQTRIIDIRGEVAAELTDSITKAAGQGVMIKYVLPIREVE